MITIITDSIKHPNGDFQAKHYFRDVEIAHDFITVFERISKSRNWDRRIVYISYGNNERSITYDVRKG